MSATPVAHIAFRRLRTTDFPLLASWLEQPHVHHWWHHETTPDALDRDFGPSARDAEPGEDLLVSVGGTPVGLVQRAFWHDYPEYVEELAPSMPVPEGAVTIDYLIGPPELTGSGLGSRVIAQIAADTWRDLPAAKLILVPVHARNVASWRALEKAGFRRVGVADLKPDNPAETREHVVYRLDRP
ncbi:GNAT family N-acetyltransferase [Amycolatopsis sp. QT-25]|uniref:GNAT family N-acetyltransferase n=1 Tax=Amycolatopsis sp. QT-25 TaxID=3034022 RepID=UPI0023EADE48|nr:GNAT family N-acetyltransferase [Amycolatopsis sp. QT-25]WET81698.1 GNAT family N-acetyltransferase [Amycolatopsis sp. QT-25]